MQHYRKIVVYTPPKIWKPVGNYCDQEGKLSGNHGPTSLQCVNLPMGGGLHSV